MDYLPCVEVEPSSPATAAVVWMHGLGADGHDFEPIVPHLGLEGVAAVRFVFPHAPAMPVTINNGYVMPAWYDIHGTDLEREVDETQLRASAGRCAALVEREIERGIDSGRIIVAGFSQGGAVGYELALTFTRPLAGLIAISSYFATQNSIAPSTANLKLPILICHGTRDPLILETHGRASYRRLMEMGYAAEYRTYPVEHGVDLTEIRDIGAWIGNRLGDGTA
jgi:phospholipase/carboxylesterase